MKLDGISFNGVPLKKLLHKPRTRRHGARTKPGATIYRNGQTETHTIIAGVIFPWLAKAPYVKSGESTLGAIEYNEEQDKIKCHECGEWMGQLGTHLYRRHGLVASEYRLAHGLGSTAKLKTPKMLAKLKGRSVNLRPSASFPVDAWKKGREVRRNREALLKERGFGARPELLNLRNQCLAQISARIKDLGMQLGRTPTAKEMRAIGIHTETMQRKFGLRMREFWALTGLKPRDHGEIGRLGGYARAAVLSK